MTMKKLILALALAFSTPAFAQECTTQEALTQNGADAGYTVSVELKGQSIRTFIAATVETEGSVVTDDQLDEFSATVDTVVIYGNPQAPGVAIALFKDNCAIRVLPMSLEEYQMVMKKVEQKAKAD